ncbi:uncharacterized protein Nmag_2107 [Natrialba magadii ATCC 43099]|uniref:Uncharacterized protein n=1 Tax=Natrialba magadii (strain ATCC 43099 / DSM 3394 / CCM 3739 / CIP 104546 / IAM 13178 / JCM 8861 / NBRC 102185 / NCIMB 2190 / MS3) TaxID=547559 RepID=D3SW15_NATMM|nr:uncharacterized protein Nmag_2107 [Natrialba magadii ATCC 43099]
MDPVPVYVETAIYGYFLLVCAIGCFLHGRLWLGTRSGEAATRSESQSSRRNTR